MCANFQRNLKGYRFSFVDVWNDPNRTWPGLNLNFYHFLNFYQWSVLVCVSGALTPMISFTLLCSDILPIKCDQLANFQNGSCAQWCKQSPRSLTTNCHLPGREEKNGTQRRTTWWKHRSCCGSLRGMPQDKEIKLIVLQSIKQGFRILGP